MDYWQVKMLPRLVITCMVVCVEPAVSVADTLISPSASSDAILSLRTESRGELRLQYRKETSAAAAEPISVGIGSDYHYLSTADETRIYDYKLHRMLTTGSANSFAIDSLYAVVWFRVMEMKNRVMLRRMLAGANISTPKVPTTTDPFWVETELGITSACVLLIALSGSCRAVTAAAPVWRRPTDCITSLAGLRGHLLWSGSWAASRPGGVPLVGHVLAKKGCNAGGAR